MDSFIAEKQLNQATPLSPRDVKSIFVPCRTSRERANKDETKLKEKIKTHKHTT